MLFLKSGYTLLYNTAMLGAVNMYFNIQPA